MLVAAATVALAAAVWAVPASANVGETIILRCTHNESLAGFSQKAYREALNELGAELEEYGDCPSLIRQALLAAAAGGRSSGATGTTSGPTPAVSATPSEQRALRRAAHAAPEPVQVGGGVVHPGVVHVDVSSAFSALPTPLLVVLALLLAFVLWVAGVAARRRIRDARSD